MLQHPTVQVARARAAPEITVDRLLLLVPQDGWSFGLAATWPQPAKELALRALLLELWDEELREGSLGRRGVEPLVAALRARADVLARGPTAHALGTARLVGVLRRLADGLASGPRARPG